CARRCAPAWRSTASLASLSPQPVRSRTIRIASRSWPRSMAAMASSGRPGTVRFLSKGSARIVVAYAPGLDGDAALAARGDAPVVRDEHERGAELAVEVEHQL